VAGPQNNKVGDRLLARSVIQAEGMGDYSYEIAWGIAQLMGPVGLLPSWLGNPTECVRLVELVQTNVVPTWANRGPMTVEVWAPLVNAAFTAWAEDPKSAPSLYQPSERKNILLRLWSGCAGAGKMIDFKTQDGPTDEATRKRFFDAIAEREIECPVYRAGVTYAYDWKKFLKQPVFFDGVPATSVALVGYELEQRR
jgi:hypothetical protein